MSSTHSTKISTVLSEILDNNHDANIVVTAFALSDDQLSAIGNALDYHKANDDGRMLAYFKDCVVVRLNDCVQHGLEDQSCHWYEYKGVKFSGIPMHFIN